MNNKKVSLAVLMASVQEAGAGDIDTIDLEQAGQIHGAAQLKNNVTSIVEQIIESAKNDEPTEQSEKVDLLSNIDIAFTLLIGSLGVTKTEVTKAANQKIVANNKPKEKKEPVKRATKKDEKQVDIEDEPTEE